MKLTLTHSPSSFQRSDVICEVRWRDVWRDETSRDVTSLTLPCCVTWRGRHRANTFTRHVTSRSFYSLPTSNLQFVQIHHFSAWFLNISIQFLIYTLPNACLFCLESIHLITIPNPQIVQIYNCSSFPRFICSISNFLIFQIVIKS